MPVRTKPVSNPQRGESGFVLLTSLVFLLVLLTVSLMTLRTALFEERFAAIDRDLALAQEMAELALRDAEHDILSPRFAGVQGESLDMPGVLSSAAEGECGKLAWRGADWKDSVSRTCTGTRKTAYPTTEYGSFTGASLSAAAQMGLTLPRYLIEKFSAEELGLVGVSNRLYYRITAVGFGRTTGSNGAKTSITLQSVFSP